MYDAPIKILMNETQMRWSHGAWNFAPVDLDGPMMRPKNTATGQTAVSPMNVTLQTTAIRSRLECEPVGGIENKSSWLQYVDAETLETTILKTTSFAGVVPPGLSGGYKIVDTLFANTSFATSPLGVSEWKVSCCANGTFDHPQKAAVGYWSALEKNDTTTRADSYRLHGDSPAFITKWIVGKPQAFKDYTGNAGGPMIFKETPKLQAARCKPFFESAEAMVSIDQVSKMVHSYDLLGPATEMDSAWYENYVRHDTVVTGHRFNQNYTGRLNITTSMGTLVLDTLLSASTRGMPGPWNVYEDLDKEPFVYRERERGLNMDLMTYAMYILANKDPDAMLDYTTLITNANRTFQAFFQQFINNKLSIYDGGAAYQKIGANLNSLERAVDELGTALPNAVYSNLNTNRTIEAKLFTRTQVLHMNQIATYLAVGIIVWLVATTAIVASLQRRYTSTMLRDVELIADVLVLVAGSDNFLELVQEKGASLKKDKDTMTKLGWFKGRDGQVRWGVEVVGGRNAVEWVDAPTKHFS